MIHLSENRYSGKIRRKRKVWVRKFLEERNRQSILSVLNMSDGSFFNFTRMTRTDFEQLLQMVGSSIARNDTKFRDSVRPEIRLAITLRYLATGDSYSSLMYTFKVSKQLISEIVPEVCQHLNDALSDYIKVSFCKYIKN